MNNYATKNASGAYDIFQNGSKISTGAASVLGNYGLSETNLGTPTVATPPVASPVGVLSSKAGQDIVTTNTSSLQKIESGYTGTSIVDYLKSAGQDSSFGAREKLAKEKGMSGYTGSAEQNTALLGALRNISGSPISGTMVDELNKAATSGKLTPAEQQGLNDLRTTQDDVTTAAAKARAALEAKDYTSMDYWTAKAEESKKIYETQLSDYYQSTKELRDSLTKNLTPSDVENDLNKKLTDIRKQADAFKLQTEQDKFSEYEGQTMQFAGGRAAEIDMKAGFKMRQFALEESNLLASLGLAQNAREMAGKTIEQQLSYIKDDFDLQQTIQEKLDKQEEDLFSKASALQDDAKTILFSILDGLQGVNPAHMDANTIKMLETTAARAGLPMELVTSALSTQYQKQVFDNSLKLRDQAIQEANANKKDKSSYTETLQQSISDTEGLITTPGVLDANGYLTDHQYKQAKSVWVTGGHTAAEFDKNFARYVYPSAAASYGLDPATLREIKLANPQE